MDQSQPQLNWRKSSRSGEAACAEVAFDGGTVHVRSDLDKGRTVVFDPDEWRAFIAGIKNDEFNLPA